MGTEPKMSWLAVSSMRSKNPRNGMMISNGDRHVLEFDDLQ